jgi:hypothetical protein
MKSQIGLSHLEAISGAIFDEFVQDVASENVELEIRAHGGVFAGIDWLMPTAIMLFISRAYFDAIFSEMGKDHYKILKRAIKALLRRAMALRIVQKGTPGKLSDRPLYSRGFSIMVAIADRLTLKFLIQPDLVEADAEKALTAFLDLVQSISDRSIDSETLERMEAGRVVGRTLLLAYDFEAERIVTVDPMPSGPIIERD